MKVYLSPSNQEKNVGYGSFGTEEDYCNVVADKVEAELKKHDIEIERNKPIMTLESIVIDSNKKKVNLHVAIHTNANSGYSRGCEVFCYKFGTEGNQLALKIYKELSELTPTLDRGVKQGKNFYGDGKHMYELAYTDAPACLIEIDFHDNKESAKWLLANVDEIAKAISRGILEHLGIKDDFIRKSELIQLLRRLADGI